MAKLVDSLVSDAVKRLVLNPEYMRAAWMREVENSMIFGMTTDEMLVRGLDKESHRLPHFAGTHCYPIFPGDAAQYAPGPPAAPALPWLACQAGAPAVQLCLALPEPEAWDCEGCSPRLHALAAHVLQIFLYLACCWFALECQTSSQVKQELCKLSWSQRVIDLMPTQGSEPPLH